MKKFSIYFFIFFTLSSQSFSQNQISISPIAGPREIYIGLKYQKSINSNSSFSLRYNLEVTELISSIISYTPDLIILSYDYYFKPKSYITFPKGFYISPSILLNADFIKNNKNNFLNSGSVGQYFDTKYGAGVKSGYQWIFNKFGLGIECSLYYTKEHFLGANQYNIQRWSLLSDFSLSLGYIF